MGESLRAHALCVASQRPLSPLRGQLPRKRGEPWRQRVVKKGRVRQRTRPSCFGAGAALFRRDRLDFLIGETDDHQGEGPVQRGFAQGVETARRAAMAGAHIHLQQGQTVIGPPLAQAALSSHLPARVFFARAPRIATRR